MKSIGKEPAERAATLLEEIRRADDLDRPWPAADLVGALHLPTVTSTALKRHFESTENPTTSLRNLMDLAISDAPDPRPGYMITPLLDLRCVGTKGFWSVINRLTELNLGESCRRYRQEKLAILQRSRRMKGPGPCSWSKPIAPRLDAGAYAWSPPP